MEIIIGEDGLPIPESQLHDSPNEIQIGEDGLPLPEISEVPSELPEQQQPEATRRFATLMNLMNVLIGAGILGIPSTFVSCGVGPTIILLILCCSLCYLSSLILLNLQQKLDVHSIEELTHKVFGFAGYYAVAFLMTFFNLSCTVARLIIAGNQIKAWLSFTNLEVDSQFVWIIIILGYFVCIPGPLTYAKNLNFLSKFSIIGALGVLIFAVIITVKGIIGLINDGPSPSSVGIQMNFGILTAFGVYALSFSIPPMMMPVLQPYNPLKKKRSFLVGITLLMGWILNAVPGFFWLYNTWDRYSIRYITKLSK